MIDPPRILVLSAFIVFSRIGVCLMVMPGISSPRIPVQARLFIAVALSLALVPTLLDTLRPLLKDESPVTLLRIMLSEAMIGAMIGMLGRIFFIALEAMAQGIALSIGLSANLGAPVNEDEPLPAIASLLTLAATALLFITDQHLEIFRALAASYTALPVPDGFPMRFALVRLVDGSVATFALALRIAAPFLIFSVVTNLAVGLVNRLVPSLQVFFLATPFLLLGGLYILYLTIAPIMRLFTEAFSRFLVAGWSERLRGMRRIAAVQETLRDLADWKLAAAERAKAETVEARAALDRFVAEERPTGAFASLAGRTAARLAARETAEERRRAELAAVKAKAEGRLRLSERFVDGLAAAERDEGERRRLEELVETMLAGAAARGEPD